MVIISLVDASGSSDVPQGFFNGSRAIQVPAKMKNGGTNCFRHPAHA